MILEKSFSAFVRTLQENFKNYSIFLKCVEIRKIKLSVKEVGGQNRQDGSYFYYLFAALSVCVLYER